METTKNKLPENINLFFEKLKNYLDAELYFYGSVQRNDYFHGSSDIDVDIFTHDENNTFIKFFFDNNIIICYFIKV
jgi:tRNA nucleotidyltransferase (CCA-adding enzyme)